MNISLMFVHMLYILLTISYGPYDIYFIYIIFSKLVILTSSLKIIRNLARDFGVTSSTWAVSSHVWVVEYVLTDYSIYPLQTTYSMLHTAFLWLNSSIWKSPHHFWSRFDQRAVAFLSQQCHYT